MSGNTDTVNLLLSYLWLLGYAFNVILRCCSLKTIVLNFKLNLKTNPSILLPSITFLLSIWVPCWRSWSQLALKIMHQFSSVTQSCLRDPISCSMPGFPVHHQLPKLTQIHVHWVGDAIQPSHLLSPPSPPTFNLFQHQGLSQGVSSPHQVAKVLELQLQHQSFQGIFRTDFL